jgi:hypothetical protein
METILRDKPWFKELLKKPELQDITLMDLYQFYLSNDNIYKVLPIITSNSNISIRVLDWFVTNYSKKFNIIYELKNCDTNGDRFFNVYLQYKCQLKSYKKKLFDPFCRKQRIAFHYDLNKCVVTTIGQLNFFKWAITSGILVYVEKNLQKITNDMINSNKIMVKKYNNNSNNEINTSSISSSSSDKNNINDDSNINELILITSKSKNTIKTEQNDVINIDSTNMIMSNSSDSEKIRKKRHELSSSANKTINIHNYSIVLSFD